MKKLFLGGLSLGIAFLMACGDGELFVPIDPDVQRGIDSQIIDDYLIDQGYAISEVDSTDTGLRYIISNEGTGEPIEESDIVSFNYIGYFTSDTIFDTSIQSVADSITSIENIRDEFLTVFSPNRQYFPLEITYSQSGWTIIGRFIPGFVEGVSVTFKDLRVGGEAIIIMPSQLGYGPSGNFPLIPPDEVLLFKLLPVDVVKQR
jgi:hypothetical protein